MNDTQSLRPLQVWSRLPWPLPAALAWLLGWLAWRAGGVLGLAPAWALGLALLITGALAWACNSPWRRLLAGAGFPLSAWVLGASAGVPAWVWLLLLLPVLAAYPVKAWRDAPFFPTPAQALDGLPALVGQPQGVLDAGCGAGHGLQALRGLWPTARLSGLEWSAPLTLLARWRCRGLAVDIRRADMWAASWAGFDLVYLFQRPESMGRAYRKAQQELAPGAWLVSLEFPVPGVAAAAELAGPGRRTVWVYRMNGSGPKPPDSNRREPCR